VALGEGEADGQIDGLLVRDTVGLLLRVTVGDEERDCVPETVAVRHWEEEADLLGLWLALLQALLLGLQLGLGVALGLRDARGDTEPEGKSEALGLLAEGAGEELRLADPEKMEEPLGLWDRLRVLQAVEDVLRLMEGLRERLPEPLLEGLLESVREVVGRAVLLGLGLLLLDSEGTLDGVGAAEGLTEGEPEPKWLWVAPMEAVTVERGEGVEDRLAVGEALGHAVGLLLRVPEEETERDREPLPDEEGQREAVPDLLAVGLAVLLWLAEKGALVLTLALVEGEGEADAQCDGEPEGEASWLAENALDELLLGDLETVKEAEEVLQPEPEREGLELTLRLTVPLRLRDGEVVCDGETVTVTAMVGYVCVAQGEGDAEGEREVL